MSNVPPPPPPPNGDAENVTPPPTAEPWVPAPSSDHNYAQQYPQAPQLYQAPPTYGAAPQNYPPQVPTQSKPSAFALAWNALWFSQWRAWSGKPLEVTDRVDEVERRTGNTWIVWVLTLGLNALLMAFALLALTLAGMNIMMSSFAGPFGYGYGYGFGGGQLVILFFFALFVWCGGYVLRGLGTWWSLRAAGRDVTFNKAMTLYASAKTLVWFPLAIFTVLAFVRFFAAVPDAILWAVFGAVALTGLSQITLFLVGEREVRQSENAPTPFKWYMIYTAGVLLSYGAIGIIFSVFGRVFFGLG